MAGRTGEINPERLKVRSLRVSLLRETKIGRFRQGQFRRWDAFIEQSDHLIGHIDRRRRDQDCVGIQNDIRAACPQDIDQNRGQFRHQAWSLVLNEERPQSVAGR